MRSFLHAPLPFLLLACASVADGPPVRQARSAVDRPSQEWLTIYVDDRASDEEKSGDDGTVETTELGRQPSGEPEKRIVFNRATRKVVVESAPGAPGAVRIERDVPAGAIVREEGDFFAFARAARRIDPATSVPKRVAFFEPSTGRVVDGTIALAQAPGAERSTVTVRLGEQTILLELDLADGRIETVRSPDKHLLAFPPNWQQREWWRFWWEREQTMDDWEKRGLATRRTRARFVWPAHGDAHLLGMMVEPAIAGRTVPAVVFVAAPTPGNFESLARVLVDRGIATLLYTNYGHHAGAEASLADQAADAAACIDALRAAGKYSSVGVVGFGEGATVALSIPPASRPDALAFFSAPGRSIAARIRERWTRAHPAEPATALDALLSRLRHGEPLELPFEEYGVLAGAGGPWLSTWLDVDPAALLGRTSIPATVVQGDADAYVSMEEDTQRLASARPNVTLVKIHGAEHSFRNDAQLKENAGGYMNGEASMVGGFEEAVAAVLGAARP